MKKWLEAVSAITAIHKNNVFPQETEEIAGIFVKELGKIFAPAGCAVFLVDDKGTNVLADTGFPADARKMEYAADMQLMQYLDSTRSSIFFGYGHESSQVRELFPDDAATSLICSPVITKDKTKGFIYLSTSQKEGFTIDDQTLVELMSSEISMLIEISSLRSNIESLTIRDELTGCFNRKKFREDIEIEIPCAERYGRPLSLLKIGIDLFEDYNKSNGKSMGDDLIRKAGEVLSYSIRMCDRLYRYNNEEFILILPGIDKERAVFAGNRLQKVLGQFRFEEEAPNRPNGKITFSIGVASFPVDSVYRDGLIKAVDSALHEAKGAGGDTVISL